mmetsp:Transcript_1377/g.3028  ORF Transcript_1377/g.3028 Transcript_1377/m.3028 type:complete len:179 (+) Transcript_1377:92-628(+)
MRFLSLVLALVVAKCAEVNSSITPVTSSNQRDAASPSASVLGLQRSTQLKRGQVSEEQALGAALGRSSPEEDQISFKGASVLGLQRSMNLVRRKAPVVEEDLVEVGEDLSFTDVSVLSLQRSVRLVRGRTSKAPAKVMPEASALGLQRSTTLVRAKLALSEDESMEAQEMQEAKVIEV